MLDGSHETPPPNHPRKLWRAPSRGVWLLTQGTRWQVTRASISSGGGDQAAAELYIIPTEL